MIVVESKNSSIESIQKKYPNAIIADISVRVVVYVLNVMKKQLKI